MERKSGNEKVHPFDKCRKVVRELFQLKEGNFEQQAEGCEMLVLQSEIIASTAEVLAFDENERKSFEIGFGVEAKAFLKRLIDVAANLALTTKDFVEQYELLEANYIELKRINDLVCSEFATKILKECTEAWDAFNEQLAGSGTKS